MQVLSRSSFDRPFGEMPSVPLKRTHSVAFPPNRLSSTLSDMRTFAVTTSDGLEVTLTTAVSGSLFITRRHSEPPRSSLSQQRQPLDERAVAIDIQKPLSNFTLDSSPIARAPSPTPTEIDDPDPEEYTAKLSAMGIKVRDYAFQPSHTAKPAIEVFDYQRACAEYDFIMMRNPRDRPVPGKTLRRLLNLGFITEQEQKDRWRHMDWDELRRYDARTSHYPSRGYPGNGIPVSGVPTIQMRTEWLKDFGAHLLMGEKMKNRMKEAHIVAQERAEQWKADTARVMAEAAERQKFVPLATNGTPHYLDDGRISEMSLGKRRTAEDDDADGQAPESPKRQRLSPFTNSLPPGYRHVQMQPSRDSSPSHSQPDNSPERTMRGSTHALRGLQRGLSRTTTFRQL